MAREKQPAAVRDSGLVYTSPELEIIKFDNEDVITTSTEVTGY